MKIFSGNKYRLLPLMVAVLSLYSCGHDGSTGAYNMGPQGPMTVKTVTVQPAALTVTESFPAMLTANQIVELRPDVTGYLEAIKAKDGSWVNKGQALYEIDQSRYEAAYNQAAASLQQAQADQAQKQRDLERYQNLLAHDAISKQAADQAATAEKTSEANVAAAKAALSRASTDLQHARVKAPASGKLGIAQVKVGDIVNAGQTLINTIVNDDPVYADFDIPQSRYREFFEDYAHPRASGKKYYIAFADKSVYPREGKILLVNNAVDPATGTLRVRLVFPNKDGELKSGMSCVVLVKHPTTAQQIAIPATAIQQVLSETSVLVVGENNVVQSRDIRPGPQVDSLLIVNEGLQPGDRVITEGFQRIKPGDTVKVENVK
ncbi:MAG TPA: efflux RND transporter periplasmic adaptor subunit [Chitinophagaceae bacterium]